MFSLNDLAAMRAAQTAHMMDTCTILVYSQDAQDDRGMPAETWTAGSATSCGLRLQTPRELLEGTDVPDVDAVLRLALTDTVNEHDRVRITHRYGEALAEPLLFEVVGDAKPGPSGQVVALRRVTEPNA